MLFRAQAANLRLTTPKAFTLTLGILGTLAHFRHFLLLMTKDEAQHRRWTFCEAVKIVLDTNVVVSGLLKPRSSPARILRLVLQGDVHIIINEHILAEYFEVLRRPKFDLNLDEVQIVLELIRSKGIKAPALPESFQLPDSSDEPFLEAALAGSADVLITGNKKHFPKKACRGQKVVNPKEFLCQLGR